VKEQVRSPQTALLVEEGRLVSSVFVIAIL
jgi:hypothetical protein